MFFFCDWFVMFVYTVKINSEKKWHIKIANFYLYALDDNKKNKEKSKIENKLAYKYNIPI